MKYIAIEVIDPDFILSIFSVIRTWNGTKIVNFQLIIHYYVHSTMIIYSISFPSISGKPVSWAFLNPSVSPFRSSSNGLIVESSNPAVRLYRYDSYTGKVITIFISRYIQYMLWYKMIEWYTNLFRNWGGFKDIFVLRKQFVLQIIK